MIKVHVSAMQATPMKRHDTWSLGRVPKLAYEDWFHPKEVPFSGFGHMVGISQVELYERVGKSVIAVCERS